MKNAVESSDGGECSIGTCRGGCLVAPAAAVTFEDDDAGGHHADGGERRRSEPCAVRGLRLLTGRSGGDFAAPPTPVDGDELDTNPVDDVPAEAEAEAAAAAAAAAGEARGETGSPGRATVLSKGVSDPLDGLAFAPKKGLLLNDGRRNAATFASLPCEMLSSARVRSSTPRESWNDAICVPIGNDMRLLK